MLCRQMLLDWRAASGRRQNCKPDRDPEPSPILLATNRTILRNVIETPSGRFRAVATSDGSRHVERQSLGDSVWTFWDRLPRKMSLEIWIAKNAPKRDHARQLLDAWCLDYNHCRPHGSLGYLSPVEFVGRHHQNRTLTCA